MSDKVITLRNVVDEMNNLGYAIDKRPYKLNVVGIRDIGISEPSNYSDHIAYFYYDDNGKLQGKVAEGTTTPSVYYLEKNYRSTKTIVELANHVISNNKNRILKNP